MFKLRVPKFSTLSSPYVRCTVSATVGGVRVDPTSGDISFAFMPEDEEPTVSDWRVGSWETTSAEYLGRCLVGPAGTGSLAVGGYEVWVRLEYSAEVLIENIGDIVVY